MDSQFDIWKFSFDDYGVGNDYEVVIDADGTTVPITAPKLSYFEYPKSLYLGNRIHVSCKQPAWDVHNDQATTPLAGCNEYLFHSKRYIAHEHSVLNGKINFWRIGSLKILHRVSTMEDGICRMSSG